MIEIIFALLIKIIRWLRFHPVYASVNREVFVNWFTGGTYWVISFDFKVLQWIY